LKGLYHISSITSNSFHCSGGFGGGNGHFDGSSILWKSGAKFHRVRWGQTTCRRDTPEFKAWQTWFHGETHKEDLRKRKEAANLAKADGKLSGGGKQAANINSASGELSGGPQAANIEGGSATLSGGKKKAPAAEAKLGADGKLKEINTPGKKHTVGPHASKPEGNEYQGNSGTTSIVKLMLHLKDELDEDVKQSKIEKDNTKSSAKKEIDDLKEEVKAAKKTAATYGKDSAGADKKKIEGMTNRQSSVQSLQSVVDFYKATWNRCADVILNFQDHVKARDMQLDNLRNVLHKLEGIAGGLS
jgi:hypothetical protein